MFILIVNMWMKIFNPRSKTLYTTKKTEANESKSKIVVLIKKIIKRGNIRFETSDLERALIVKSVQTLRESNGIVQK
jgi:hypothetical protein